MLLSKLTTKQGNAILSAQAEVQKAFTKLDDLYSELFDKNKIEDLNLEMNFASALRYLNNLSQDLKQTPIPLESLDNI